MIPATITGYISSEPEAKFFQDGGAVCSFSVAVKQRAKKDKNGDWIDPPGWFIKVKTSGKIAATVADKYKKGDLVVASGQLEQEHWNHRETGEPRSQIVMVYPQIELMMSKLDREAVKAGASMAGGDAPSCPPRPPQPKPPAEVVLPAGEADIPF